MIPAHYRPAEEAVPLPEGFAVITSCCCGLAYTGTGETVRGAKRVIWRKAAEHQGFTAAAGPGWAEAA